MSSLPLASSTDKVVVAPRYEIRSNRSAMRWTRASDVSEAFLARPSPLTCLASSGAPPLGATRNRPRPIETSEHQQADDRSNRRTAHQRRDRPPRSVVASARLPAPNCKMWHMHRPDDPSLPEFWAYRSSQRSPNDGAVVGVSRRHVQKMGGAMCAAHYAPLSLRLDAITPERPPSGFPKPSRATRLALLSTHPGSRTCPS